jgi:hypothetical protein
MNKIFIITIKIPLLFSACKKEEGCMDPTASNYNSEATLDNGECYYTPISGCTDSSAINYLATANISNDSCEYLSLNINFKHYVDGLELVVNEMIYTNPSNVNYSIQTLRYLISDIIIHSNNGDKVLLDEVHFIDISIDSTLTLSIPQIHYQNYTSISFTMGLDSVKNITNLFLNENFFPSFVWPEFLGGGYHYMQLEGDFNSLSNGYATHTGGTNGIDFSFSKEFPIIINSENDIRNIYINMEIANWYQNPNILNFVSDGIMDDPNTQVILNENGIEDVFSAYTLESPY